MVFLIPENKKGGASATPIRIAKYVVPQKKETDANAKKAVNFILRSITQG